MRVGGAWVWLWVALDPQRRTVLEVYLSKPRNGLVAASFMRKLLEKYGEKVLFVTDGGKWYPRAAQSVGARWVWLKGGARSYVERLFRTIKDRMRVFNCAFPRSSRGLENARAFLRFYAYYYNHVRPHQSLNQNTPIPSRKATRIQKLQKALEVKKNLKLTISEKMREYLKTMNDTLTDQDFKILNAFFYSSNDVNFSNIYNVMVRIGKQNGIDL